MKYKLLVLDVDGTLLNNQKEISPRTLAALLKVQQMGVHIVLASGRPTNGVMPIAEKLELNHYGGYILSYNGGQIINVQTGELLFEKRIDPEWIPYFEKKAKKNDFAIFTYHKDFILTDKPDNKYVIQEANLNKMQIVGVDNFAEAVDFPPCKCMLASDDEEALIGLENHWKKRLDGVLDAFRSEPYFLEVVPQFIDKGNTLGVLMTKLSVSPEEVIAIGDGVCDVTMLQLAGVGIAMGNAEDSVKACVDKTTLTNEEEGVAVAVFPYERGMYEQRLSDASCKGEDEHEGVVQSELSHVEVSVQGASAVCELLVRLQQAAFLSVDVFYDVLVGSVLEAVHHGVSVSGVELANAFSSLPAWLEGVVHVESEKNTIVFLLFADGEWRERWYKCCIVEV